MSQMMLRLLAFAAEQKARPQDPSPNIRLLKLYVDKKHLQRAYAIAVQIESECSFRNDISWYQALVETIEVWIFL
jgi:hypothetical protein